MLNVKSQEAPVVEEGLKTALIQVQVLGGATAALIVTEPTISGRHDMERVAELAAFFRVPAMVCVNKYDLNPEMGQAIEAYTKEKNMTVLGRIPFDPVFTKAMVQGKTVIEYDPHSDGALAVKNIWEDLARHLGL